MNWNNNKRHKTKVLMPTEWQYVLRFCGSNLISLFSIPQSVSICFFLRPQNCNKKAFRLLCVSFRQTSVTSPCSWFVICFWLFFADSCHLGWRSIVITKPITYHHSRLWFTDHYLMVSWTLVEVPVWTVTQLHLVKPAQCSAHGRSSLSGLSVFLFFLFNSNH